MKKLFFFIINMTLILVLMGCWEKKDLDQMTLAVGIGIDKKEDGFEVTAQVMNPFVLGQNPLDQASVVTISQEGDTIFEAIRKMSKTVTGKLFIAHFDVIVFGEELAKEGIEKYLKFFLSDPETQHKKNIIIVKGDTAKNLLSIQTMLNLIPSISIFQKNKLSLEAYGSSKQTLVTEAYSIINSDGIELTLAGMSIKGDPEKGAKNDNTKTTLPDSVFSTAGIAVFKKEKLVGWFSDKESIGYNHIMGNLKSFIVTTTIDENTKISFESFGSKAKMKVKLINNKPHITIDYQIKGRLGEVMTGEIEHNTEYYKKIEKAISKEVKQLMQSSLDKAIHEFNSDVFGFGQIIHRHETKYWNKNKENYDEILKEMDIKIKVKTTLIEVLH